MKLFRLPQTDRNLIRLLTLVGILLAIRIITALHGRINNDATLYLEIARRLAEGDTQGALSLYNWPLFPWLMAKTHGLTGLSVQYAAHLLNVMFYGIATWSLLTLIHESGGNRNTIVAGAMLLFSAPYITGDVLPMIMRDQGFWAFYLLSLLFFLRFYRSGSWEHALTWQIAAILAVLFRVEAVTFVVLLPLALVFDPDHAWPRRRQALLKAYALPIAGAAVFVLAMIFVPSLNTAKVLGRLVEMQTALQASYHQLTVGLATKANIYAEQVLNGFMADYALTGLILTLIAVLIGNIIGACGWLGFLLGCFIRPQGNRPARDAQRVLLWVAGLNLLNFIVIILTAYLFSGRYAVALAFVILIFAAFHLANLYETWRLEHGRFAWPKKAAYGALAALLGLLLLDNLIQRGTYPDYEQQAGAWVKQHLPSTASIYFDEARMRYYAGAAWNGRDNSWDGLLSEVRSRSTPYDYLVLHIKHKHAEAKAAMLDELHQYRQIQQFAAKNGDKILIFRSIAVNTPAPAPDSTDEKGMK